MRVRSLRPSDIPILQEYAARSGFPYPEPSDINIEKLLVVADDDGKPIAAVAAKRLVELFAWINPEAGAQLRADAIEMIRGPMAEALRRLGYECAEAFIPPQLERRGFGRFLTGRLGFVRNLVSYGKRIV